MRERHRYRAVELVDFAHPHARMVSSTLGEFNYGELVATLHPEDAAARNVSDGDVGRIFNDLGEVICRAEVQSAVRPGVVSMPKGAWRKSLHYGSRNCVPDEVAVRSVGRVLPNQIPRLGVRVTC